MRKCPVCKNTIGFWAFFKPGFKKSAGPIKCTSCGSTISPPWSQYNWLGFLGFGLMGLSIKFIPKESLGIESKFLYYFYLLSFLIILVLGLIYLIMPLDKKYNESE